MRRAASPALKAGAPREAELNGRRMVVVPVVALREGVIHASNSTERELVLAAEFAKGVASWNGRPVMADHPVLDGEAVSANDPRALEGRQLGWVYGARVDGKALKMEAWLDPEMCEKAGSDVLERLATGVVDVSVGVLVSPEARPGKFKGDPYEAIWRGIAPDHLAMLPAGKPGACSVAMGCGAPRAAAGKGTRLMAKLTADQRDALPDSDFAAVWTDADGNKNRKLPVHDKDHADKAAGRVDKTPMPADVKAKARKKIADRQKQFGEAPKQASAWGRVKELFARALAEARGLAMSNEQFQAAIWNALKQRLGDPWGPQGSGWQVKATFPDYVVVENPPGVLMRWPVELDDDMDGDDVKLGAPVECTAEYPPDEDDDAGLTLTNSSAGSGPTGGQMFGNKARALAGYPATAAKAEEASAAATEASNSAGEDGTAEDHDAAADAHTAAALAHGKAAQTAKAAGNSTAAAAHMDKMAQHNIAASEHSDKAMEASKEAAPEPAEKDVKKTASGACECQGRRARAAGAAGKETSMSKREAIGRILAAPGSPFKGGDEAALEVMSEARLAEVEASLPKPAAAKPEEAERGRLLAAFPDIAQIVEERQASDAARRVELVGALKGLGAFTEAELTAMPLPALEKTAKAVQAASPKNAAGKPAKDFSGLGVPRGAANPEAVPAPPSLKERLAASRGTAKAS